MVKLTARVIGYKHYEGVVDITDPCYSKGTWCRMNATVKAGEYSCIIYKFKDPHESYQRVGIIGIYLDHKVPDENAMEKIGEIGVDAGLAGFFMDKPDYTDNEWDRLCNSITKGCAWIKDDGFFSSSGYGDGMYDVYAYRQNGEIVALEIRFI